MRIRSMNLFKPLEVLGIRTSQDETAISRKLSAPRPHLATSDCLSGVKSSSSSFLLNDNYVSPVNPPNADQDPPLKSSTSPKATESQLSPWDTRPLARQEGTQKIHVPTGKVPSGDGKFHCKTLPVRWKIRINNAQGRDEHSLLDSC